MKNLIIKHKLFERGLILAPFMVWFSNFPNFYFGRSSGMNLEISLAIIYLAALSIIGLPNIFNNLKKILNNKAATLTGFFVFWNFISIFWSSNKTRTFLTAGMFLMLWLIFIEIITIKCKADIWEKIRKSIIYSGAVMGGVAILQSIYGTFTDWGLCGGCLAAGFGFVRVSAFTIEPQFFGSLMIAPIFLSLDDFIRGKKNIGCIILMAVALYLTLSRGAIFAFIIGLLILFVSRRSLGIKKISFVCLMILSSFFIGGLIHAVSTELNPRISDGFGDSISKSINQISLGKISVTLPKGKVLNHKKQDPKNEAVVNNDPQEKKALFDGYVEKSTNERTNLNNLAIKTWSRDIFTIFFGVGLGSAGREIYSKFPQLGWEFEIVQNEYIAVLLEIGLIGWLVFIAIIIGLVIKIHRHPFLISIIGAYLLQWGFFSGLPNLLHVYLFMMIFFVFSDYYLDAGKIACYNANVNKK